MTVHPVCSFVFYGLLTILAAALTQAQAQSVTPSHVYQAVETLVMELQLLHQANETQPVVSQYLTQARRPRHVMQKAREVYVRVQDLREMNGLPRNDVPPFPLTEITPADVMQLVQQAIADIQPLKPIYVIDESRFEAAFVPEKTPTDVYINLFRAGELLSQLELPAIVPNNVHQAAMGVISDINLILAKQGQPVNQDIPAVAVNKKPAQVYEQAQILLQHLQGVCTRNADLCPPAGVTLPPTPQTDITPAYVLDLLNNVLAEVGSIKVKAGVDQITQLPKLPSGKTPSDIFDVMLVAQRLVDTIE